MKEEYRILLSILDGEVDEHSLGDALKNLRETLGVKQTALGECMGVGQAAISKLESRDAMSLSSLTKYVSALGGRVSIEAVFNEKLRVRSEDLSVDCQERDRQLDLPLNRTDGSSKDVVLSIKPTYTDRILSGRKTVELRRRFTGTLCADATAYIYSTSPVRALVGTANISSVRKLPVGTIWDNFSEQASVTRKDFRSYFKGREEGYVLIFNKVKKLDHPISLKELRERFSFQPPQSFHYANQDLRTAISRETTNVPD